MPASTPQRSDHASPGADDARVVPRRHVVSVHHRRPAQQEVELDAVVAGDARVRRASALVLCDEVVHHVGAELAPHVQHVVRHAQRAAHAPRVLDVLDGTATAMPLRRLPVFLRPQAHRNADHVVALARQQQRGDGRIDAARHSGDDAGAASGSRSHTHRLQEPPALSEWARAQAHPAYNRRRRYAPGTTGRSTRRG